MIEYRVGDLLSADLPAIAHGCNTKGIMGSGIALPISKKYPEMYEQYRLLCDSNLFVLGDYFHFVTDDNKIVFNLATQTEPGPNADLFGITIAIRAMTEHAWAFRAKREPIIGLPRIGAGIGALEWSDVELVINIGIMKHPDVQLIVYTLPEEVEKFEPWLARGEEVRPDNEEADLQDISWKNN